jgi:hypothetical protein
MPHANHNSDTTTSNPTYAIVYGVAEGAYASRDLRKLLEADGFLPAPATEADILIAHSGGSYVLPKLAQAKLVIHINPPHWPGKSLARSLAQKIAYDFRLYRQKHQLRRWLRTVVANACYTLNLKHTLSMMLPYAHAQRTYETLPAGKHVFIRTYIDSYCSPQALLKLIGDKHSFLTLAGHHDDCWREPEPYLKVIRSLYN